MQDLLSSHHSQDRGVPLRAGRTTERKKVI
jgi:hypothetical protein